MLRSAVITELLSKPGKALVFIEPTEAHFNNDGGYYTPKGGTFNAAYRNASDALFQARGGQAGYYPTLYRREPCVPC